MKIGTNSLLALMAGLILAGCQTTRDSSNIPERFIGKGPIVLSARTADEFQKYENTRHPALFIITKDGKLSRSVSCRARSPGCYSSENAVDLTLSYCTLDYGQDCKLYAFGKTVVWKGPVSFSDTNEDRNYLSNRKSRKRYDEATERRNERRERFKTVSSIELCLKAVDYLRKPFAWTKDKAFAEHVGEARDRNLFLYQCAYETGHF